MLRLEIINDKAQHFFVSGDEPFRVEVNNTSGRTVAFVYRGAKIDKDQEPDLVYDGNNATNVSAIVR